jgi:hypothetical protein
MSELITRAFNARQTLAHGLALLQGDGVPPSLVETAAPIARAMGLLHELESAGGSNLSAIGPEILASVQRALGLLQDAGLTRPQVAEASGIVAQVLGQIHELLQMVATQPTADQSDPRRRPTKSQRRSRAPAGGGSSAPSRRNSRATEAKTQKPAQDATPREAQEGPQTVPVHVISPAHTSAMEQQAARAPAAEPNGEAGGQRLDNVRKQSIPLANSGNAWPMRPENEALPVEAALGAHSSSNFYRGVTQNNVLNGGGIFIATYNPPPVGQTLQLRVAMPGGYEFSARGVVRWCRDAPGTASMAPHAPPGYGAELFDVSPEGQQLIARYVKNRDPLLYDDM